MDEEALESMSSTEKMTRAVDDAPKPKTVTKIPSFQRCKGERASETDQKDATRDKE